MRTSVRVVVVGTGAALAAALLAPAAAAGGGTQTVQVRDECDPENFTVDGQDLCAPGFGGDVSVDELFAALHSKKGARAMDDGRLLGWRNKPVRTSLDEGEGLKAVSRGGEFHSFSKVDELDGGCVDDLNEPLGLALIGEDGNNCPTLESAHGNPLPPGESIDVPASQLEEGTNLFQCLIHPWMHTTVHVD